MADRGRSTMDFFAAQAAAKRRTGVLVVLFALAWALTVLLADVGITLVLSGAEPSMRRGYRAVTAEYEAAGPVEAGPERFRRALLPAAGVVSAIILLGTAWHALRLGRDGGDALARMLGGVPVDRSTQDPDERRAVNVLEEMSIAAAVPVPRLYVLPEESSINAFAAGSTPDRAVVAVTRGALDQLSRDELQGVLAHELSHVLHADARLNMRLIAVVGGLTALALVGRLLLRIFGSGPRWRSRSRGKGAGAFVAVGLVFLVAGAIGAFFGRLIRLAVSRQREFLADAAAVQFTRNPAGLAGALAKIRDHGSALANPHAPEAAHFFFANGLGGITGGFLSTHPPLDERLKRLRSGPLAALTPKPAPEPAPRRGVFAEGAPTPAAALGAAALPLAAAAAASIGRPAPEHLAHAHAALAAFPDELTRAAREPFGARAVALALVLDGDAATRQRQLGAVRDPALAREVDRLGGALGAVAAQDRLPLLDLALPALDSLSPEQARAFLEELAALAAGDGRTTLHEWALQRLVRRRLAPLLGEVRPGGRVQALAQVEVETLDLLSALAWAGHREPEGAQRALDAGVAALGIHASWRVLPRERIDVHRLDAALAHLDQATPPVKARLVAAAAACVLSDGHATIAEAELLRAVAGSMGLPMPSLPPAAGRGAATAA
ncbi:MAG TPA: M48 family metallopeptidase [Anaeromyxobacter sp.]|nr:M48 family metallopeptidase [Anaeromyxobacter sp.]